MFYGWSSLKNIGGLKNWDVSSGTNFGYMFSYCSSLKSLPDISKWNTKNVNYMQYMFLEVNKKIIPKKFINL